MSLALTLSLTREKKKVKKQNVFQIEEVRNIVY